MSARKPTAAKVIDLMEALKDALDGHRADHPEDYCPDCTHALNAHGLFGCAVASCPCVLTPRAARREVGP